MRLLLFYCMSMTMMFCYADRQQEDFLQAQHLAQDGKYQEALVLYDTIVKPGYKVWFNKAVCLYQLGKYCDALLAFKKAQLYADSGTYQAVDREIMQVCQKGSFSYSDSWQDSIRVSTYYIPIIVAQLLLLFLMIVAAWYIILKPRSWKTSMICFIAILQAIYVSAVWYVHTRKHAVIITGTSGYTGPGNHYQAYVNFPVGNIVNIDKKEKNWYKVKNLNNSGWVKETSLVIIEEEV